MADTNITHNDRNSVLVSQSTEIVNLKVTVASLNRIIMELEAEIDAAKEPEDKKAKK
jgi:hypothetical protein